MTNHKYPVSNSKTNVLKTIMDTTSINLEITNIIGGNTKNENKYTIKTKSIILEKQKKHIYNLAKKKQIKKLKNQKHSIQDLQYQENIIEIQNKHKSQDQEKIKLEQNKTTFENEIKKHKAKIKNQKEHLNNQGMIIKKQIKKLIKQEKIILDLNYFDVDKMETNKTKIEYEKQTLYTLNEMIKKKNKKLKNRKKLNHKSKNIATKAKRQDETANLNTQQNEKLIIQEKNIQSLKQYILDTIEINKEKIQNQSAVIEKQKEQLKIQEQIIHDLNNQSVNETQIFKNQALIIKKQNRKLQNQKKILQDLTNESANQSKIYKINIPNLMKQSKLTQREKHKATIQNQNEMLNSLFKMTKKQKTQLKMQEKTIYDLKNQKFVCEVNIQNQTKELKNIEEIETLKKKITKEKEYLNSQWLMVKKQKDLLKNQKKIIHEQNQTASESKLPNQVIKNLASLHAIVRKQKTKLKMQEEIIYNLKNQKSDCEIKNIQNQTKELKNIEEIENLKKKIMKEKEYLNSQWLMVKKQKDKLKNQEKKHL